MENEKRLIDANAIEYPSYFYEDETHPDPFIEGYRQGKIDAICEIRVLAPTVDAVEVVHGEWISPTKINGRYFNIFHCSVCNGVPPGVDENTKYCAHCGARMDLWDTKDE